MYGITPFVIILATKDPMFGATVAVLVSAFAVGMTLLTGEAAELLAASDLQVLGHRPVSSRTYMAVRVATLSSGRSPLPPRRRCRRSGT